MYRFLLGPRWLALHALAVTVVTACAVLGWWQLSAYREAGATQPRAAEVPVDLDTLVRPGERLDGGSVGRAVRAVGRYEGAEQLLIPDRPLDGRVGYHVVTPLVTADGAVVAVRRGWVPDAADPALRAPAGTVTVTGVLQPSESGRGAGQGLPEGQVAILSNEELMIRLPYAATDLYDGFVALTGQQPVADPAPQPVPPEPLTSSVGWRNLSYAAQWWIFGAAAAALWGYLVRGAAAERRGGSSGELVPTAGT